MKIYVLDDNVIERAFWEGYESEHIIKAFSTSLSFRQAVLQDAPDAAVVDLFMPEEPGDEVCRWLKGCFPDVIILVCTGAEGDAFKVLAENCGALFASKLETKISERLEMILNGRN